MTLALTENWIKRGYLEAESSVNRSEFTEDQIHNATCRYVDEHIILGAHRYLLILQKDDENAESVQTMLDFYGAEDTRGVEQKLDSCWIISDELADMLRSNYFCDYGTDEWAERMGQVDGDGRGYWVWFTGEQTGLSALYSCTWLRRLAIRELRKERCG